MNRMGKAGAGMMMAGLMIAGMAFAQSPQEPLEEVITIETFYPSPWAEFEEMRLYPTTREAGNCDSGRIGYMYYDDNGTGATQDDDAVKVCKGTLLGWQELGGGLWTASGNDIYNSNTDNVGIGTISPGAKLEVTGGIKLGNDADACNPAKAGSIRWDGTKFQGCNGVGWGLIFMAIPGDGTTQETAGTACKTIRDNGFAAGDRIYWIDPNGGSTSDAFQVYCDMTSDGGGWTLIATWTSNMTMNDGSSLNTPILSPSQSNSYLSWFTIGQIMQANEMRVTHATYSAFKIHVDNKNQMNWGSWASVSYQIFNFAQGLYKTPNKGWYSSQCSGYSGPQDMTGSSGNCGGPGTRAGDITWGYDGVTVGQGNMGQDDGNVIVRFKNILVR